MKIIQKRFLGFLFACIPARLLIAWIAKKVIPKLSNANVLRTWAAMSVDVGGYPLLGEHPKMKNFFVVVSQNGYTLGPILGDLISNQILFDKKDYDLFDSSRLN